MNENTPNRHDLRAYSALINKSNRTVRAFRPDFFTVGRGANARYTFPRFSKIVQRDESLDGLTKKDAAYVKRFFRTFPRSPRCVLLDVRGLRKYARESRGKTAKELRAIDSSI